MKIQSETKSDIENQTDIQDENTQSENQIDSQIENTNSLKFRKLLFELIMSSFVFFIFVYIFTVYKYKVK